MVPTGSAPPAVRLTPFQTKLPETLYSLSVVVEGALVCCSKNRPASSNASFEVVVVPIPTLPTTVIVEERVVAPVTPRVDPILTAPLRVKAVVVVAPLPVTEARVELLLTVTPPILPDSEISVPAVNEVTPLAAPVRVIVPPRETTPPPLSVPEVLIVTPELTSATFGIFDSVLAVPDILLLLNVWV